jgi:hypothetical protein
VNPQSNLKLVESFPALALACTGLLWLALLWNLMNFDLRY